MQHHLDGGAGVSSSWCPTRSLLRPWPGRAFCDIFGPTFSRKNPEDAASILLAAGEAHAAGKSLQIEQGRASYQRQHRSMMNQRSRQSQKMSQSSTVSSWTKKNQTLSHRQPLEQPPGRHRRRASARIRTTSPCFLEHRNLSVLERCIALRIVYGRGLFLNSASPHDVAQVQAHSNCFACHHKHVFNFFYCHHKAGWRMLSREF